MEKSISANFAVRVEILPGKYLELRDPRGTPKVQVVRGPLVLHGVMRRAPKRDNEVWVLFREYGQFGLPIKEDSNKRAVLRDLETAWGREAINVWKLTATGKLRELF